MLATATSPIVKRSPTRYGPPRAALPGSRAAGQVLVDRLLDRFLVGLLAHEALPDDRGKKMRGPMISISAVSAYSSNQSARAKSYGSSG
jgi:hypothetical protein